MSDPDPRAVLSKLATERGDSLSALSRMLGRNVAYLQQYVKRGSPRVLPERERRLLSAYLGVPETRLGGASAPGNGFRIPRLDVAVSAGPGAFVDGDIVLGTETLDPALVRKLGLSSGPGGVRAGIVRVRGDSMQPGLIDGDHLVVDTADCVPTSRAGVFVIRIDGATMVKRVARTATALSIASDNPLALPVPEGEVDVIGRVVWLMRAPR